MCIERGSTWNRWDFHLHTPYSILNNEFGFNIEEDHRGEHFDNFVKTLFEKAVQCGIVAIGVTDYFSIDGYKRIREEYLSKPDKMRMLFPEDELRNKVKQILVFPNIEFRIDTFVGKECHSVNYHVLFSEKVPLEDIEKNFLHRLEILHDSNDSLPLIARNIKRIGREYKAYNRDSGSDLLVGLKRITVNYKNIYDILRKTSIFQGKYLISVPVDEDLSKVDWIGRDYPTRKAIYRQSDLLMTSNPRTREWALAKGHEEKQIDEFRSIKPCIWGSDAHSYERMFAPDEDKFCWIKAEPTFEGLQQILYEPEERVRIQKEKPDEKDAHQVIDYIQFQSTYFMQAPIYFSEGLTAIIGGKSTGKSMLLRHLAKTIDPDQVQEREEKVSQKQEKLDESAEVVWKDGASGKRKIIYIPQSWLNRIADEGTNESQLNDVLRDVLLQNDDLKKAEEYLKNEVSNKIQLVKHHILDYVECVDRAEKCERILDEHGRSAAYSPMVLDLERQLELLSAETGLTEEMFQNYTELAKRQVDRIYDIHSIKKEYAALHDVAEPFVFIPSITKIGANGMPHYDLEEMPIIKELMKQTIHRINMELIRIWKQDVQPMQTVLAQNKKNFSEDLLNINKELKPLKQRVLQNDRLKKLEDQLRKEKEKQKKAKELERDKAENIAKAQELKSKIIDVWKSIKTEYQTFQEKISSTDSQNKDLKFDAEIGERVADFADLSSSLFDNRKIKSSIDRIGCNIADKDSIKSIDEKLLDSIWEWIRDERLSLKGGNSEQIALERMFTDWFYIHYILKSGGDTINQMSPGKKALVLLEMLVNLEQGKCPILIDQPEDDLDNRSIYTELVQYLRNKKHERQIIVVTHNANVVIGSDAEAVIIANQDGKEAKNNSRQFEYRCGAIENVLPLCGDNDEILPGVLNQKGIQQQICDILEGGMDAFEMRRKKYIHTT